MEFIVCCLIGYLIGTFNPSFLFGKKKGVDIREKGSGNAGASNTLILFGKSAGLICALIDIFKAYVAISVTNALFPHYDHTFVLTAVCCVLGHIFPFYMKFKGGKGLATLGGMILRYNSRLFLLMLALEIVIALVTGYICFVPVTASIAFPFIYGFIEKDIFGTVILLVLSVVIIFKHRENFKRIKNGTEMHLSYLWKPKAEMDRLRNNADKEDEEFNDKFML
ncbi:MAG: glycerol-3-phosphate 1-O-acyltransferase PlsY [Clostridia bacterium]|nr:glycerol-3-phosphate 1-O-acyltransferase PlsY [Clostridia bacterium]